jgi:hypothetical protein
MLLVHPFRDGNGRLARWLAELMFFQAGYLQRIMASSVPVRKDGEPGTWPGFNRVISRTIAFWLTSSQRRSHVSCDYAGP